MPLRRTTSRAVHARAGQASEPRQDVGLVGAQLARQGGERAWDERHPGLHAREQRPVGGIEVGAHRHIPNLWARSEEKIPDGRSAGNSRITSSVAVS